MNVFSKMNRKERREFEKLNSEDKEKALFSEINPALQKMKIKIETDAFLNGYFFAFDNLYSKYNLKNFDTLSDSEKQEVYEKIFNEIIDGKKKFVKHQKNNKQKKEGNTDAAD